MTISDWTLPRSDGPAGDRPAAPSAPTSGRPILFAVRAGSIQVMPGRSDRYVVVDHHGHEVTDGQSMNLAGAVRLLARVSSAGTNQTLL